AVGVDPQQIGTAAYFDPVEIQAAAFIGAHDKLIYHLYAQSAVAGVTGGISNVLLAEAAEPAIISLNLAEDDTVVIGKMADLENGLGPGERTLDLPNKGTPKANWVQNSSKLREAMSKGNPIRDASAGKAGSNTGFLSAERELLQDHGWTLKG